ncbi:MAG TPA: PepSY domain-containing protein [Steroidobacteraceae bacterium]|nr:PepSY domain-containing protein [Steroidobacteraceae bacterium]
MTKLRKGFLPVALLAMGCASLSQAHGLSSPWRGGTNVQPPARLVEAQRDGISLDEAVRRAEQQYHARVVRTEVQDEDGRKVYVLKLLSDDGRVIQVRIDAATGRMR